MVKSDLKQAREIQYKALTLAMAAFNESNVSRRFKELEDIRQYVQETDQANNKRLQTLSRCHSEHPDTCSWFFDKPQFQSWACQDDGLLLVHGPAGCGKSVLAATCLERFRKEPRPGAQPFYFFCNEGGSSSSRSWQSVLQAWIVTLTWQPNTPELLKQLGGVVEDARKGDRLEITFDLLLCALSYNKATVVLDGLDELNDEDHEVAIKHLCRFARRTRVLVLFRNNSKIAKEFAAAAEALVVEGMPAIWNKSIAVQVQDTQTDITSIVTRWVKSREAACPSVAMVQKPIIEGAQGMFLWVRLMLEHLTDCETESDFEDTLKVILPGGIGAYYDRFIDKALSQYSSDQRRPAALVLRLIAFSLDTITLDTVNAALRFHCRHDRLWAVSQTRSLLHLFSPLIQVEPNSQIIHTVHASVMDHLRTCKILAPEEDLRSPDFSSTQANHAVMFKLCIEFLTNAVKRNNGTNDLAKTFNSKHSFLEYAVRNVWRHLSSSGRATKTGLDLLSEFFEAAGKNTCWMELTALLGMDYRVRDQMTVQSSLRTWLKTFPSRLLSAANVDRIKRVEDGVLLLYRNAVKYCMANHAADDVRIARSIHALGSFLYSNGQIAEAIGYLKHAASRYDNPETRQNYENDGYDYLIDPEYLGLLLELACCLSDIEPQNPMAAKVMNRAHQGSIVVFGSMHPTTVYYTVMLAEIYSCQGDLDRAIALFVQILGPRATMLPTGDRARDLVMMRAHHNLGKAYLARGGQGDLTEAERHLIIATKWRCKVLGDRHPTALRSMTVLGEVHLRAGQYEEAWNRICNSRVGLAEARGPDSTYVHLATQSLGDVRLRQGRYGDAIKLYDEARLGLTRACGSSETSEVAAILEKLAEALEAEKLVSRARSFRKEASLVRSKTMKDGKASLLFQRRLLGVVAGLLVFLQLGGLLSTMLLLP